MKIRTPKRVGISKGIGLFLIGSVCLVMNPSPEVEAIDFTTSHLGTYEGETTFTTFSSTGISPGLTLEVDGPHDSGKRYETQSGSLTLSETEEGATIKSAILKGKTLVNLSNAEQEIVTTSQVVYDSIMMLKPNTKYTIMYEIKSSNELTPISVSSMFRIDNVRSDGVLNNVLYGHSEKITTSYTFFKKIITSKDTTAGMKIHIRNAFTDNGLSENTLFVKNLIVLEGDYTDKDIPYFEGMQSVRMPVLTITNGEPESIEDEKGVRVPNPAFQSTTVTVDEPIALRSKGDVYDELDLVTGKYTQRIGETGEVLTKPIIKTVKINSDSTFRSLQKAEVTMVGDIQATIASVTLPVAPLSFVLNPNNEPDQQFIASEFSITNNSQAPLTVELKEFVQTTKVLNDVAPDHYDKWKDLTREESKSIALGLVPQPSENWLSFNPGVYYVAETANATLGRIRSQSTVDFGFRALHGQAFESLPNPQYRLTFVFGF